MEKSRKLTFRPEIRDLERTLSVTTNALLHAMEAMARLFSRRGIWTCGENFYGPVASFASGAIDDPFAQLLRSPGLPGKGASRLDPRSDAATHQRASRLLAAELLGKEPAETKTIIDTQVRKSGF